MQKKREQGEVKEIVKEKEGGPMASVCGYTVCEGALWARATKKQGEALLLEDMILYWEKIGKCVL